MIFFKKRFCFHSDILTTSRFTNVPHTFDKKYLATTLAPCCCAALVQNKKVHAKKTPRQTGVSEEEGYKIHNSVDAEVDRGRRPGNLASGVLRILNCSRPLERE